jgi:hypothetical protein
LSSGFFVPQPGAELIQTVKRGSPIKGLVN